MMGGADYVELDGAAWEREAWIRASYAMAVRLGCKAVAVLGVAGWEMGLGDPEQARIDWRQIRKMDFKNVEDRRERRGIGVK